MDHDSLDLDTSVSQTKENSNDDEDRKEGSTEQSDLESVKPTKKKKRSRSKSSKSEKSTKSTKKPKSKSSSSKSSKSSKTTKQGSSEDEEPSYIASQRQQRRGVVAAVNGISDSIASRSQQSSGFDTMLLFNAMSQQTNNMMQFMLEALRQPAPPTFAPIPPFAFQTPVTQSSAPPPPSSGRHGSDSRHYDYESERRRRRARYRSRGRRGRMDYYSSDYSLDDDHHRDFSPPEARPTRSFPTEYSTPTRARTFPTEYSTPAPAAPPASATAADFDHQDQGQEHQLNGNTWSSPEHYVRAANRSTPQTTQSLTSGSLRNTPSRPSQTLLMDPQALVDEAERRAFSNAETQLDEPLVSMEALASEAVRLQSELIHSTSAKKTKSNKTKNNKK